ncbi:MAG: outer membrane protein assembly factor BamE [Gammaproteobacteria bacterium]|nr:outer membrane protein assembly factor BamE [Gammaproteobacteria bacterium]
MKTKRFTIVWLLLILMGFTGCITVGNEFPVSKLEQIKQGTSRAEVEKIFGQPWRVGKDSGYRTWTYAHYKVSLFSQPKTRDLVVRFNAEGKVVSYTFNSTYREDENL